MKRVSGFTVAWAVFILWGTVVGLVEIFKASIALGAVSLFVQGTPFLQFLVRLFTGYDIAQHIAHAMGLTV